MTASYAQVTEALAALGVLAEAGLLRVPLPDTLACGRDVSEQLAASRPEGAPAAPGGLSIVTATMPDGVWELRAGETPVAWAEGTGELGWLSIRWPKEGPP